MQGQLKINNITLGRTSIAELRHHEAKNANQKKTKFHYQQQKIRAKLLGELNRIYYDQSLICCRNAQTRPFIGPKSCSRNLSDFESSFVEMI